MYAWYSRKPLLQEMLREFSLDNECVVYLLLTKVLLINICIFKISSVFCSVSMEWPPHSILE